MINNNFTAAAANGFDENNNNIKILDTALKDLNPRWKNWVIRVIAGLSMITGFVTIIYLGPFMILLLIFAMESQAYREVISIGQNVFNANLYLPWFQKFCLYFYIIANYFMHGQMFIEIFNGYFKQYFLLGYLVDGHYFVSFSAYMVGFVAFVMSLNKPYLLKQLTLFGYMHLALLLFVTSANGLMRALCQGLVWFLIPTAMNIFNDIMAYMFGFFFGKTRLIQVSPKKTWEGYIGAAFTTVIFGCALASIMIKYKTFTCPLEYDLISGSLANDCTPNQVFKSDIYMLPFIHKQISIEPFLIHIFFISIFISIIGPFGGFFASGFKRAINIKDFGSLIPGHGGVGDRFDCIHIMSYFVYIYYQSFILESTSSSSSSTPNRILNQVFELSSDDQLIFKSMINSHFNR